MPRYQAAEIRTLQDDFSGGIVGRLSPLGLKKGAPPRFVKRATNLVFRPVRAMTVRPGYRDASQAVLTEQPLSIGKHSASGGNKLFVATDAGGGSGNLWLLTGASRTQQTMPWTPTDQPWAFEMADGLLIGCQRGHAHAPVFYHPDNPANTWLELKLPSPAAAPTGVIAAGGSLTASRTYYYRVRYRYRNGSSEASAVSSGISTSAGNQQINLTITGPASPRSDYVGWTLERTKANGSSSGPWYFVADAAAGTTTYSDAASDASLFYEADETIHGEPPTIDGCVFHRGRLFGWYGSTLYLSQPIVGEEATGIANWTADLSFQVGKDDGDSIQSVVIQGERLLIGKGRSLWSFEGDDIDSFRLVIRYEGAGFAGPHAAAPLGGVVFFAAGQGRIFVARGNTVEPVGFEEVGDYLATMDPSRDSKIQAVNHLGDMILFWYATTTSDYLDNVLVYDLRTGVWTHFDNMPSAAAIVQKDTADFSRATLLFADPTLLPPGNASLAANNPSYYTWSDYRATNTQIYVQKLASDGSAQWGGGVVVSQSTGTDTTNDSYRKVTSKVVPTSDGCIVVWCDGRSGSWNRIYASRLDASGALYAGWTVGGNLVESFTNIDAAQVLLAAVSDGSDGAVVMYQHTSVGGNNYTCRVLAQHVTSTASMAWNSGAGVLLSNYTPYSTVRADCAGTIFKNPDGSYSFWYPGTYYTGITYIAVNMIQKLSSSGALVFAAAGLPYSSSYQMGAACSDVAGGLYLASVTSGVLSLRRTNATNGASTWNATVNSGGLATGLCCAVRDLNGGCIVVWEEASGTPATKTIYARRVNSSGTALFAPVVLATATQAAGGYLNSNHALTAIEDGFGGAIFAWDRGASGVGANAGLVVGRMSGGGAVLYGPLLMSATAALSHTTRLYGTSARLSTDGAAGAYVVWGDDRTSPGSRSAINLYVQHVDENGDVQLGDGGQALVTETGEQDAWGIGYGGGSESEYPPGVTAGYHVWCGLSGPRDRAWADGQGGDLIQYEAETHKYDDGVPDNTKEYDWIEVYVNLGVGDINATVACDGGASSAVVLRASLVASKYNSGVTYNSGAKYAASGASHAAEGLRRGTEGRSASVVLSGASENMEIGGFLLTSWALPRKDF